MARSRSAVSGKFVDEKTADANPRETVTEKTTAKKAAKKSPPKDTFTFPEELGNDYHPYMLRLRIYAKQLEEPIVLKGVKGNPGDYVFQANDGGVGILTEEELNQYYQTAPPSPAA